MSPRNAGTSLRSRILFSFLGALLPLFALLVVAVEALLVPWIETRAREELANATGLLSDAVHAGATVAIRNHLKAIAEQNREIARHHLELVEQGILDRDEAISRIRRILLSQKVGESGYLYCIDSRGIAVVHPNPGVEGTDNTRFAFVREQMRRKEGYIEYDWRNPGEDEFRPKALYMVHFEPLDWIISASSYRSEFSRLLDRADFREAVLSLRFGSSGYAYVVNADGDVLIHPSIVDFNVFGQAEVAAEFVRTMLEQGDGFIEYDWGNPDEPRPRRKLAAFDTIPELGWTVVSSAYRDEVMGPVRTARSAAYGGMALLMLAGTGAAFFLSVRLSRPMEAMVRRLDENARSGREDPLPVPDADDMGRLAREINRYLAVLRDRNAEIRRERARYRGLVQTGPDAIFLLRGREIFDCNPATLEIFRGSRETLIGMSILDLSPPTQSSGESSVAMARRMIEACRGGAVRTFEWTHRALDGADFEAEVCLKRFGEEEGEPLFVAFMRDVTERKRAENALRLFKASVESSTDAIGMSTPEGEHYYQNAAFDRLFGDIGADPPTTLYADPEVGREVFRTLMAGGRRDGEVEMRSRDGDIRTILLRAYATRNAEGRITGLTGIHTDVTERKRAERALRESESFLKSVLESVQEGIGILNPDLTIHHVNPIMEQWYRDRMPLVGKRCHEIYHERPEPCPRCPALRCLRSGGVEREEVPGIPGSDVEWLELFTYPMKNSETGEIRGIVEFVRDITARKRAETALRESEERFRAMIQSSGDMIFVVGPDNVIAYESPSISRILGYPPGVLVGTDAFSRVHPDDLELVAAEMAEVFRSENDGLPTEFRFRRADGEWIVMEALASNQLNLPSIRGIVVTARDITRRKRIERALRENEENLRVTLASIGDAVIATDTAGRVTRMNPVAETLTGWSATEAKGKPLDAVFSIVDARTREPAENPVRQVLSEGRIVGLADRTLLLSGNGAEFRIADSGAPIRDDAGRTLGVVIVFRDITEEHAIQEELHQNRKMDAVGQLAGGVAHDFNNMLGGIMGAAEILKFKLRDRPESERFLDMIVSSVRRASDLTAKLLAFARKQPIGSTPVDVHVAVRETLSLLENTIDRRIRLESRLEADESVVIGDLSQLQNAFLNLGINASQAMPDGGSLVFATRRLDLSPADCKTGAFDLSSGPFIEIEVRDTGRGIPAKDLPRIFEPFFTTKPQGEGTGLGLAAVFGTVRRHEGAVTAYSEEGRGTVFRVWLPIAANRVVRAAPPAEPVSGSGRVLVVDDEPVMRATAEAILEELGYEVLLAEDGRAGLECFAERHAEIDLVLLDMVMPEMNGRDCFLGMRKIDPDARVVLSSGFTLDEDLDDLRKRGLRGFVRKPYRIADLSLALARARTEEKEK